ncbi:MAG: hypothetical protein HYV77_00300 [Candidatus Wildermuthbacteria bacterium]|nr:hypothetical protein [Candidatus Wildermuthbacteria bacterium]
MEANNGKDITIEDLAGMIQRGFEETAKKADMDAQFAEVYAQFAAVDNRFHGIEQRLERIENLLIDDHQHRIAKLEEDVRVLKDALNMK